MPRRSRYSRDESLSRAMDVFWARGYQATSLKDLEDSLDMRPGSIYAAFGSKESLFLDALDLYARGMGEEMAAWTRSTSLTQGLRDYFRALSEGRQEGPAVGAGRACLMVKSLLEAADTQPVILRYAEAFLSNAEARFAAMLEGALERGELRPGSDCRRLARHLQSQIMGLRVILQRPGLSPTQRLELADDMLAGFLAVAGIDSLPAH